jgi:hypothetical protein
MADSVQTLFEAGRVISNVVAMDKYTISIDYLYECSLNITFLYVYAMPLKLSSRSAGKVTQQLAPLFSNFPELLAFVFI